MRLFLLASLTMLAFAANSVLNRLALAQAEIGPATFGLIRVASAALALSLLMRLRRQKMAWPEGRHLVPVASLVLYITGFSYAYVTLDAGIGALILFGGVQVTMFAGALGAREPMGARRWLGALLAFGGLVYLLAPSEFSPDPAGTVLMAAAAAGWGVYSLIGRRVSQPLAATGANFLYAVPAVLLIWLVIPETTQVSARGATLAVISGVVTSGLGYALWYSVLPRLDTSLAAVAQLTVPVIALAGGVVFLDESVGWRFVIASVLVLGGVAVSAIAPKKLRTS
jgi:drug/metabolite transporter (DMT)-like permease